MTVVKLSLNEIQNLALEVFSKNGCDSENASALTRTVVNAERDGSHSHGLFRVPGYVASLRSGKVNGVANPKISHKSPVIINVNGDGGYAPLAIERGIPALAKSATEFGIAAMTVTNTHHFAALWPEVEALAEKNLVGMACVRSMPVVAPFGSNIPLFGTNPLAFVWPRKNKPPFVFDMATSAMAHGEVSIAARDGFSVPLGTGLDEDGNETTDPAAILKGVLLPFGGYKGSVVATMVELLAAGATGEGFSFEAKKADNGDGGPPRGGEFFLAFSPTLIAEEGWEDHCEKFFDKYESIPGARLPGARRHNNRNDKAERSIDSNLVAKIKELL
jgi:delta1-piperideine-2-carboxylate reductase